MRPRALVLAIALLAVAAAPARAAGPSPGAAGIGDPLFPGLGNGGYDVQHYDLDLRYATSAPSQPIDGTVTIVARATQALSSFDLDFAGQSVGGVSVDGRPAQWRRDGDELVVTPRRSLGFALETQTLSAHRTRTCRAAEPAPQARALAPARFRRR